MKPEIECSKKDKRLLVLLALGATLLLFNFYTPSTRQDNLLLWFEIHGNDKEILRISPAVPVQEQVEILGRFLPGSTREAREGMVGLLTRDMALGLLEANMEMTVLSPRLSYYLGRPLAINRASVDDLVLLPGIGPHLARNITSYRSRHGKFMNRYELEQVPGIGPKILSRISPLLVFH